MKQIKQLGMAAFMTLMLVASTFAGEIHTGVVSPSPPPPQSAVTVEPDSLPAAGEIQTASVPEDLSIQIILSLFQLLSVY
jgi:hypothetical protein